MPKTQVKIQPPPIRHASIPILAMTPHPRNYRAHPETQIERLGASLARFGQVRSIVVQEGAEGRYLIVAGHGLTEAARRNGITHLHADIIPANWTPEQVEGYLISDNLTSSTSEDDMTVLAALLQEQQNAGYDLESLGFSDEALDQLLADLANEALSQGGRDADDPDGGGDDFDASPDEEQTRVHLGDIWQVGRHRLWVGDCTNEIAVHTLMEGHLANLCATDPPYGVNYVGKTKDALTIQNDGSHELGDLLTRAFAVIDSVLLEGAAIYIAHPAGAQSVTFGVKFLATA